MKIFLAVFAAIICAAVVIIGYLRFETRYDSWQAHNAEAMNSLKGAETLLAIEQRKPDLTPDDLLSFEDHAKDARMAARNSLLLKPWPLSHDEEKLLLRLKSQTAPSVPAD